MNRGFFYGATAALVGVVAKMAKYSGAGGKRDLPWAIFIVLGAGLIAGFLWQLGPVLIGRRRGRGGGGGEQLDPDVHPSD